MSPALFGSGVAGGYAPADLRAAYVLPSSTAGAGQTIAVVDAYHDPSAESDLSAYRSAYGLPACTSSEGCFRQVNQTGSRDYPPANSTWAREISLDLDMVSAVCPACHILLVEARNNEDSNLAAAENEAVALGATEISNSFYDQGASEEAQLRPAYDHPGTPITAAAGDDGYGAHAPASDPNVIAVGGTTLERGETSRGWTESVWGSAGTGEGSGTGSGCSTEAKPAWQTDGGCLFRTNNDVAAVGDPNTPVSVYDSYETKTTWLLLGGTSAATPIVAGAMALASPYTKSFDGAKSLYLEALNEAAAFNDVLSGLDGSCGSYLCEAGPGYDAPSGLGSLKGAPEVPPPLPVSTGASAIGQTSATLAASIDPHGAEIQGCKFQYGPTTAYGASVACSALPGSGTSAVPVSASVAALAPGSTYHFRIAISYPGGSGEGADSSFTTLTDSPLVLSEVPAAITATSVSLNAQINPNGAAVQTCDFEYGSTTSYGSSAPCASSPGGGLTPVTVSAAIAGLKANGAYHFRVAVANATGISYGSDQTFRALPYAPSVLTGAPSAPARTSATLNGTVDPHGSAVISCAFELKGSAADSVPCAALPGPLEGPVAVSALLSGLTSGASGLYRIVAANAGGISFGAFASFTTLVAHPATHPPVLVTGASADLASTTLAVSARGAITLRLRCPARLSGCRGTITLRALRAAGAQQRSTPVATLAVGFFSLGGGRVSTITIHLRAAARRLLARRHRLRARATIVTRGPLGLAQTRRTVLLRAAQ